MTAPQGLAQFPGVQQVLSATYTLAHGVSPSAAILEIVPQQELIQVNGTLTFTYDGTTLKFPECRVDVAAIRRGPGGFIVSLPILDRRWKWAFGEIDGLYNLRKPNGDVDPDTEKSPQALAKLLLDAMGESGYSVSELPDEPRPGVDWVAANPAAELDSLANALGCRVVLSTDNRVSLRRLGEGAQLPESGALDDGYSINFLEKPDEVKVVGDAILYEAMFELEAVGKETKANNYKIVPIDELSYKPAGGWEKEYPDAFSGVSKQCDRNLALESVFRWYRVKKEVSTKSGKKNKDGKESIIDFLPFEVTDLWQILPIETTVIESSIGPDGIARRNPAKLDGTYWQRSQMFALLKSVECTHTQNFSIDAENGVVIFNEQTQKFNDTVSEPAELYLTVAFHARDPKTRQYARFTRSRRTPGEPSNTKPQVVRRDDVLLTVRAEYDGDRKRKSELIDNRKQAEQEADYYLDAEFASMQSPEGMDRSYAGIIDIPLDGAVHQVSWSTNAGGAITRAGRNTEFSLTVPAYKERQRIATVNRIVRQQKQNQNPRAALAAPSQVLKQ